MVIVFSLPLLHQTIVNDYYEYLSILKCLEVHMYGIYCLSYWKSLCKYADVLIICILIYHL